MDDVTAAKQASATPDTYLCAVEVFAAFAALSADDKLKLDAIERIKRWGTGFERGQLLHEAFCQVVLGERRCPRDVPLMAFLVQTMRSLASHERARQRRTASMDAVAREGSVIPAGTAVSETVEAGAADLAQRLAHSRETVEAIISLFDGDEKAQLVIMGWADGCRGAALREATGLDQAAIDYAAKRIRKTMKALYPNGWTE